MAETLSFDELRAELAKPEPLPRRVYNRLWWKVSRLRRFPNEVRFKRERMQRGFSEADAWDLFAHLSPIISEGCRELIRFDNGHPSELSGGPAWHKILTEIADGFEAGRKANQEVEPRPPELDRAFELLAKWWEHLWD